LLILKALPNSFAERGPRLLPSISSFMSTLFVYSIFATSTPSSSLIAALARCKFFNVLLYATCFAKIILRLVPSSSPLVVNSLGVSSYSSLVNITNILPTNDLLDASSSARLAA